MTEVTSVDHPEFEDHEMVVHVRGARADLSAIIAIHDTGLGPALGGCRVAAYPSNAAALGDVLRLSRGMSYKAALAGLPMGGGKSVILVGSDRPKTPAMMRAMGRAVARLSGAYIVAEDVGTSPADMDLIAEETTHVAGLSGADGDPSPHTARGVFLCLEAAHRRRTGRSLDGAHVAVKGLGSVGFGLARHLRAAGARLTVADVNLAAVDRAVAELDAAVATAEAVHQVAADVFAPCALGGDLAAARVAELGAPLICGAANNQLVTEADAAALKRAGVLYCPDYLVNAGGLISAARGTLGFDAAEVERRVSALPATLDRVLSEAERSGDSPATVADRMARARFRPDAAPRVSA